MKYDIMGRELPDDTPVEMPVGFKRPKPLTELVRDLITKELSRQAELAGQESFEEANDFDVEDDDFPVSAHELDDDEAFRYAEQKMLDRAKEDMDNERTVNSDRNKESAHVQQSGTGDNRDRAGKSGETVSARNSSSEGVAGSGKGVSGGTT